MQAQNNLTVLQLHSAFAREFRAAQSDLQRQDTNRLLVALAEQQILQAKRLLRDAEARAINADVRFRKEGKAVLDAQVSNSSQAMLAWRRRNGRSLCPAYPV